MRLLHTSDWHLGQTFFGESRAAEHEAFLQTLVSFCVSEAPDVLLLCGDVFDTINPNAEAEEQWYGFLASLAERAPHVRLQVIAGNHDSPARLAAPSALVSRMSKNGMDIHARAAFLGESAEPERGETLFRRLDPNVHLRRVCGRNGVEVCLALVPYLRPSDVPTAYGVEGSKPLQEFIAALYLALADDAERLFPGMPLVLTGHLFAAGGLASEHSERKIQRGNLEALPVDALATRCSYFALGHLHRAQALGPEGRVRYCGSPLPLSFTEADYAHQVLRVDIAAQGSAVVTPLPLPRARRLVRLPRFHAPPSEVLAACDALHVDAGELAPFVEARVALESPQPGLRQDIERRLLARGARLIQYSAVRNALVSPSVETAERERPSSLADFSALEIFERCYKAEFGQQPAPSLQATFLECADLASNLPGDGVQKA